MLEIGDPGQGGNAETCSQPGRVLEDEIHALGPERAFGRAVALEQDASREAAGAPAAVPERPEAGGRREMGRELLQLRGVHVGSGEQKGLDPGPAEPLQ